MIHLTYTPEYLARLSLYQFLYVLRKKIRISVSNGVWTGDGLDKSVLLTLFGSSRRRQRLCTATASCSCLTVVAFGRVVAT